MPIDMNKAAKMPAATGFVPSEAQEAYFNFIRTGKGNAILEAVAGAGKTTTILEGMAYMEGRVWFGVYNKKMATEIKGKIMRHPELRGRPGLYSATFHSAGYSALRFAFGRRYALEVNDKKVISILRTLLAPHSEYIGPACAAVSMAKNRGIGPVTSDTDQEWEAMIENYGIADALPEGSDVGYLIDISRTALTYSNNDLDVIDYDDMVYLPLVRKLKMLQHEWVMVDEAQDTNPTRRAMAKALLAPGGRFVAVGDPHQAIFGFTGADNDSLQTLAKTFDCIRLPLTVTYRCPKAVVREAQKIVSHITAHESAPEGIFRKIDQRQFTDEVAYWDAHDYGETAILCRLNAPLVSLCFALIRADIPAKIEGREIAAGLVALATRWASPDLEDLEDSLEGYHDREMRKAIRAENSARAQKIDDEYQTMLVLIQNTRAKGGFTTADLVRTIHSLFGDGVSNTGIVTLCSAHKSKGMEWKKVYLYGRNAYMPNKWARKDWELEQEQNLIYVALTRAMQELVEVKVAIKSK
jgi:DNA helicase II / ATP-dependent DNA helicase PcrA